MAAVDYGIVDLWRGFQTLMSGGRGPIPHPNVLPQFTLSFKILGFEGGKQEQNLGSGISQVEWSALKPKFPSPKL